MSPEDATFLAAFETGTLPKEAFRHREHIRMSWLYLRRDGVAAGAERIAAGIRRFAAVHGATMLYHETLTRVWIRLVVAALGRDRETQAFDDFVAAHPELLDKQHACAFHRPETLQSAGARAAWVEPDLRPLP